MAELPPRPFPLQEEKSERFLADGGPLNTASKTARTGSRAGSCPLHSAEEPSGISNRTRDS